MPPGIEAGRPAPRRPRRRRRHFPPPQGRGRGGGRPRPLAAGAEEGSAHAQAPGGRSRWAQSPAPPLRRPYSRWSHAGQGHMTGALYSRIPIWQQQRRRAQGPPRSGLSVPRAAAAARSGSPLFLPPPLPGGRTLFPSQGYFGVSCARSRPT